MNERVATAARALSSAANGSTKAMGELAEECLRDHPTLQQNIMRFCIAYIEGMAEKRTDPRNERAGAFAKAVVERTTPDERNMGFIV